MAKNHNFLKQHVLLLPKSNSCIKKLFVLPILIIGSFILACICSTVFYAVSTPSPNVFTSNLGKVTVSNNDYKSLNMRYDDYFSFSDDKNYSNYCIVNIKSEEIRSYKVFKGTVTTKKDTSVLELDKKDRNRGVHAVGIGTAKILLVKKEDAAAAKQIIKGTYNGDSININAVEATVSVQPAKLTMMLLTGQSNMSGACGASGYHPEDSILCPRGQVYSSCTPKTPDQFKKYTDLDGDGASINNMDSFIAGSLGANALAINGNELVYKLDALTEYGKGKSGPDSGLAYEYNKLSGDKVWIINLAYSGSNIDNWNPKGTESGPRWLRAKAAYEYAEKTYQAEIKAKHFTQGSKLVFWLQGEADRKKDAAYYQSSFDNYYNAMQVLASPDYWGIISVRAMIKADLTMTGPRISQRYMTGGFSDKYANVYMVSDVNEQWATDSGVESYFKETYPSGYLDYPLRSNASIRSLPTTEKEVHSAVHYSQIGHNENGIDAAYNMYHVVAGTAFMPHRLL